MKIEGYLVTTTRGTRCKRLVWNTEEPMALDHPERWIIEKTDGGIQLRDTSFGEEGPSVAIPEDTLSVGATIRLPGRPEIGGWEGRELNVTVVPLKPIRPAYMPLEGSNARKLAVRPSQLVIFAGLRRFILGYRRFNGGHRGYVESSPVFTLHHAGDIYELTGLKQGVTFEGPGEEPRLLREGVALSLAEEQLLSGVISWGNHWWRITRIAIPEPLPMILAEEEHVQEERILMTRIAKGVAIVFALVWMVALLMNKLEAEKPRMQPQKVELKQPKFVPPRPEPPKPKPPEPPKPKPKPPEKKPKPKPKPPEKKTPKPRPRPAPKKAAPKPPPKPVKVAPPPPPSRPPQPKPPTPPAPSQAQIKAKQEHELAQSLNFLSPSMNKAAANIGALDTKASAKAQSKYNAVTSGIVKKGSTVLRNMANTDVNDGPISTTSSRNMGGNVKLKGKTLNDVQGRVSVNGLYAGASGADLGGSLSASGINMSGAGTINESLLLKVLSKYLQKFQYCYEKALLSDASLAGNVLMEWTIEPGGSVSSVKVVRTQINNAGFKACMQKEISRIHDFPSPKGGPVVVKYPFSFSSSSL